MWVVTIQPLCAALFTPLPSKDIVVTHKDGSDVRSLCQATRLVREQLVREGKEELYTIVKAEFHPRLQLLSSRGDAA
jgi:hypothetical protein